jgi:hypothetical protein
MAYTQTNERADPEKYAMANVRKEKTLRSRTVAVFLETTHSLPAIETAIILRYSNPIQIVATCPASGKIIRSKIKPPIKRIELVCLTLSFINRENLCILVVYQKIFYD